MCTSCKGMQESLINTCETYVKIYQILQNAGKLSLIQPLEKVTTPSALIKNST